MNPRKVPAVASAAMTDRLNVAAEGARSQGTIVRAGCWRCGEEVSVRVPAVEVHQLNHERERAEKAEAALVLIDQNCVALANDDEPDVEAARRLARQIAAERDGGAG